MLKALAILSVLASAARQVSGGTTDWTEVAAGSGLTDYEEFDPTSSLIQYRFTSNQALQGSGDFYVYSLLYTASSSSFVGQVQVRYNVVDNKITDSSYLYLANSTGGECLDSTVLQGELAELVTWNMTSTHVPEAIVNGTDTADFTSCGWEDSVAISRMRTTCYVISDVTGEEVMFEYRTVNIDDYTTSVACSKPTIDNATVSPSSDSVAVGEHYTVTCDGGYSLNGSGIIQCNDDGTLSTAPACIIPDAVCGWGWEAVREQYATCINDSLCTETYNNTLNITGIKLSGSESGKSGFVVATIADDKEVVLCNEGMGANEINAICRELGYNQGVSVDAEDYDSDIILASYPFGATQIRCPEDAAGLISDCQWTAYEEASVPCFDGEQIAVSCGNDSAWEFRISESGVTTIKTNQKGKTKGKAYFRVVITKYGIDIPPKPNTIGLLANLDSNGTLSSITNMQFITYKYDTSTGYFYGTFKIHENEPSEDVNCFVYIASIFNGNNADPSKIAYEVDEACSSVGTTEAELAEKIKDLIYG